MQEEFKEYQPEDIDALMASRGYELWSTSQNPSGINISHVYLKKYKDGYLIPLEEKGDYTIKAVVRMTYTGGLLDNADIQLSCSEFPHFMTLSTAVFDLFHPKAAFYQNLLKHYIEVCLRNPKE